MLEMSLEIKAKNKAELETALAETLRQVRDDNLSGGKTTESLDLKFHTEGNPGAYAITTEEGTVSFLSMSELSSALWLYNHKSGNERVSLDDVEDDKDNPSHEPRQAIYNFAVERDFWIEKI